MAVNASDSLFLLVKGVPILRFIAAETYGNISYAGSSRVGRGPRTLLLRASILLERCADEEIETYMEGPVLGCVRTATYVAQVAAAAGARGLESLVDAALHARHPWANPPSTTGAPCCPLDVCGPAVAPVRLQWGGVIYGRGVSCPALTKRLSEFETAMSRVLWRVRRKRGHAHVYMLFGTAHRLSLLHERWWR
jgi:hypothetical protein